MNKSTNYIRIAKQNSRAYSYQVIRKFRRVAAFIKCATRSQGIILRSIMVKHSQNGSNSIIPVENLSENMHCLSGHRKEE